MPIKTIKTSQQENHTIYLDVGDSNAMGSLNQHVCIFYTG